MIPPPRSPVLRLHVVLALILRFLIWCSVQMTHFFFGREPVWPVAKTASPAYAPSMAAVEMPTTNPTIERDPETRSQSKRDPGYTVICWDDPVNLMDYVSHVFQKVFGWPKQKAEFHMLQVHKTGKSALARESLEKAEFYVHQLQRYHLHATLERES